MPTRKSKKEMKMRQWKPKHKKHFEVNHFWVNVIKKSGHGGMKAVYEAGLQEYAACPYTDDIHEAFRHSTRVFAQSCTADNEFVAMCWYGIEPA